MPKSLLLLSVFCVAAQTPSFADFQYQDKTQITGGSALAMMKVAGTFSKQARQIADPMVYQVFVQGNRMSRVSAASTEIIDLDAETITNIDHTKKQYTALTFEQMKRQLERAAAKAQEAQAKQTKQAPASLPSDARMDFDVKVRETGAQKDISGVSAKESILNLTLTASNTKTSQSGALAITNDMWLAAEVPGYSAVREFYMRYAAKMGTMVGENFGRMLAAMPIGMNEGTAAMMKEMSKLKGVPILQVMRVGSTVNGQPLPAASESPLPASAEGPSMPSAGDVAKSVGTATAASALENRVKGLGGLAGGIGGLGGLGRNRKKADQAEPAAAAVQSAAFAVLMETVSEMSGFSTAPIEASRFQPPVGYKQVAVPDNQ